MKRFVFIALHADYWPMRQQCQLLGVSPSGYYAWRKRVLATAEPALGRLAGGNPACLRYPCRPL